MITSRKLQPAYIQLDLDSLYIVLDALDVLIQDIQIDPAYNERGRERALLQTQNVFGAFCHLYTLTTREGYRAISRYQPITAGTTVTQHRPPWWSRPVPHWPKNLQLLPEDEEK